MSFIWAPMLVALVVVPMLIAGYSAMLKRHRQRREELAALSLKAPDHVAPATAWRRHLPFAIFLTAITVLIVAFARPELVIAFPRTEGTVIIALDSSTSMIADDFEPTRLDAATAAATAFVERRPDDVEIGLVSFTNGAVVTQAPTKERDALVSAIERLRPEGPTSVGQGVFTALGAIAGSPIAVAETGETVDIAAIDIGYYSSAVVLVFSDGENTTDFDPIQVAELAANAGVKIFAVGVGSQEGSVVEIDGFTVSTQLVDDDLRMMAEITDGQYFATATSSDFDVVYDAIDTELRIDAEKTEATSLFALVGAVLLLAGAGLSFRWFGRVA